MVVVLSVACRGFRRPLKKPEQTLNDKNTVVEKDVAFDAKNVLEFNSNIIPTTFAMPFAA